MSLQKWNELAEKRRLVEQYHKRIKRSKTKI